MLSPSAAKARSMDAAGAFSSSPPASPPDGLSQVDIAAVDPLAVKATARPKRRGDKDGEAEEQPEQEQQQAAAAGGGQKQAALPMRQSELKRAARDRFW